MVKRTVEPARSRWLFAARFALLLAATWLLCAVYMAPPSQLEAARAMMRGNPLPTHPGRANYVLAAVFVVLIYAPGLALIFRAMSFRRDRRSEITPPTF